ncbi:hypothetical protein [Horticoccus sp. 23ND18S-11]|uniref:hypothetical protein n=1 Tax=Horticoccus sp. 23ND18S-11 TaxID=3391832 RepID=UPI0039C9AA83
MRAVFAVFIGFGVSSALADTRVDDVAQIHLEAIGGRERVAALNALRATGQVSAAGKTVVFRMVAARPARLRLETESGGRIRVQGTDGVRPAWEFDSAQAPSGTRAMPDGVARTFVSDAEFDDPLIAARERGFTLEYAGEGEVDGRKYFRVLATRTGSEPCTLGVDASTYLIVQRTEQRSTAMGRKVQVVTRYADFRPVAGVLLPHEVTTAVDGRVTQQTSILRLEANPVLSPGDFAPIAPQSTGGPAATR